MKYDVIIIGAGPGGIFTAYELTRLERNLKKMIIRLEARRYSKGIGRIHLTLMKA